MVEAEGASRALFNKGYKYTFAVLSTSEQYLASAIGLAAEVAEQNGKKPSDVRVAMVFENDAFSLDVRAGVVDDMKRSEEHTTELQSLMRISYAVFCLKKKKKTQLNNDE